MPRRDHLRRRHHGWGECFGPARLNAAIVAAYRPYLVGQDALATERHWQTLYNQFRDQGQKGLAITALSGVDIALWDLKGKHFGAPVHVLMGGPLRREVAAYATGTYRTDAGDPMRLYPRRSARATLPKALAR